MKRAFLAEHDGLPFRNSEIIASAIDLGEWMDSGFIEYDLSVGCFRLTDEGKRRAQSCCRRCVSWKHKKENFGECWSSERIGDDKSRHAGITHEYSQCECFTPIKDPKIRAAEQVKS